jgi:hypothetical protein
MVRRCPACLVAAKCFEAEDKPIGSRARYLLRLGTEAGRVADEPVGKSVRGFGASKRQHLAVRVGWADACTRVERKRRGAEGISGEVLDELEEIEKRRERRLGLFD